MAAASCSAWENKEEKGKQGWVKIQKKKNTTSQSSHTFDQKKTKINTGNMTVVGKQKPPTPCIS
jgi:hypothetical protein